MIDCEILGITLQRDIFPNSFLSTRNHSECVVGTFEKRGICISGRYTVLRSHLHAGRTVDSERGSLPHKVAFSHIRPQVPSQILKHCRCTAILRRRRRTPVPLCRSTGRYSPVSRRTSRGLALRPEPSGKRSESTPDTNASSCENARTGLPSNEGPRAPGVCVESASEELFTYINAATFARAGGPGVSPRRRPELPPIVPRKNPAARQGALAYPFAQS